ncbi:MAG: dephospho-CoA kinase [Spirochaetes bacterium GWF1_51_8]|nr:MAG: dephospho-CoA kinase [Spirochaetes bacterium GWF1_51_8]
MEFPVVGLVGKVACGKSTVARFLADEYGFIPLEADRFGHSALEVEKETLLKSFGKDILLDDGKIDRRILGSIVFANASKLSLLNSIVHPHIKKSIAGIIAANPDKRYVIDAALLFEIGLDELCDYIISVEAPEELIRERIKKYRSWDDCKASGVLEAQRYLDFFSDKCHFIIFNNGDLNKLKKQLEFFIIEIF